MSILLLFPVDGQSYLTPYVASKVGLMALTRNVAHSQKWHGIRCNALNIGWTETPNEHIVQAKMGKGKDWLLNVSKVRKLNSINRLGSVYIAKLV